MELKQKIFPYIIAMANSFDRITMLRIIIKALKIISLKQSMSHSLIDRSIRRLYEAQGNLNSYLLLISKRDIKLDKQYLKMIKK
jgi:hypothetical protein